MMVKELIQQLSKYNPNANVTLVDSEDIQISYIVEDKNTTIKNTKQLFIEGCDFDNDY